MNEQPMHENIESCIFLEWKENLGIFQSLFSAIAFPRIWD